MADGATAALLRQGIHHDVPPLDLRNISPEKTQEVKEEDRESVPAWLQNALPPATRARSSTQSMARRSEKYPTRSLVARSALAQHCPVYQYRAQGHVQSRRPSSGSIFRPCKALAVPVNRQQQFRSSKLGYAGPSTGACPLCQSVTAFPDATRIGLMDVAASH